MPKLQTRPSRKSVRRFHEGTVREEKIKDCFKLPNTMEDVTVKQAKMWGGIVTKLGKSRLGKSCLNLNKLDDIDFGQLQTLVAESVVQKHEIYDCT